MKTYYKESRRKSIPRTLKQRKADCTKPILRSTWLIKLLLKKS